MNFVERQAARRFEIGDIIFRENDAGSSMFIIQSGEVEVFSIKNNQKVVYAHLGSGAVFGEMALIDGLPRSATVIALETTQCLEISKMLFQKHLDGLTPWLTSFFRILAERLRDANKHAETLTSQDNSRQVILMVSNMLAAIKPNKFDQIIASWKPLVKDIALILNLPYDQVDAVLNKITLTPMAKSVMNQEDGRMLVMKDYSHFKFFADYCKSRFYQKQGNEVQTQFQKMTEKEIHIITFLHKFMKEQMWEPDIEQPFFMEQFDTSHAEPLSTYKIELGKFRNSGLIDSKLDGNNVQTYIVNKEKLQTQLSMTETIAEFEQLDAKI